MPYIVLADNFLLNHCTKEAIVHNCRLSRGRRMVESASGILASQLEIFLTTMKATNKMQLSSSSRRWTSFSRKFWPSQRPLSTSHDPGRRLSSFFIFIWQMSCLMLSSHLYLGLPCDFLMSGFQLNIFLTVLVSGILCTWPNHISFLSLI